MPNKNLWLIGYGGIAKALIDLYNQEYNISVITRQPINDTLNNIENLSFIKTLSYSVQDLSENLETLYNNQDKLLPEIIIVTTGILHRKNNMPEKTITQMDNNWLLENIDLNLRPSLEVAKFITPLLKKDTKLTMCCLSARVSSISDNKLGGWHSYRMSKAMLNMLIKNISIEWKIKSPNSIIFGYHPGTVDTSLSKPFQSKIKHDIFSPNKAAEYLNNVINNLSLSKSGCLIDWQNQIINP